MKKLLPTPFLDNERKVPDIIRHPAKGLELGVVNAATPFSHVLVSL